eukprot:TRINITY_DN3682_c0_g1_i1.p2 TRINITY_DN3682_c0_g1~~TRINITY_DN3682_c0_g1_i1.p2  ORF type:complete len:202 (-),score=15.20 TRINITY_DN3682_c0_g1_i1:36-641(-)
MPATASEIRLAGLCFLALALAISGGIMFFVGVFEVAEYDHYKGSDFTSTTCFVVDTWVSFTTRSKRTAFFVDIVVNFTVSDVTRESIIGFGAYEKELEATFIVTQLRAEGQVPCYYHPADDFPLLQAPSLSYLHDHGLGVFIPGCISLTGGIVIGCAACFVEQRRVDRQRRRNQFVDSTAPATSTSVEIGCVKNAAEMQRT